jgi:hypothetical protein
VTGLWKVQTFSNCSIFPCGFDAAWIFFEIDEQRQADQRGTAAKGAGPHGAFSESAPVLLVFRLRHGCEKFFATVQSWPNAHLAIS